MPDSPTSQTLLGFDFGLRRIGVAVGQSVTQTATPLEPLLANQGEPNWDEVAQVIKHWRPDGLIVGIPVHMDGTEQAITLAAKQFAAELAQRFQLPVHTVDERLTTKEARQQIFAAGGYRKLQKVSIDSYAAKLMVESWLHT